jgi:hypothetical protein
VRTATKTERRDQFALVGKTIAVAEQPRSPALRVLAEARRRGRHRAFLGTGAADGEARHRHNSCNPQQAAAD